MQRNEQTYREIRKAARVRGQALAKRLKPGSWVLAEARSEPAERFWLGRTVAVGEWGGACVKKVTGRTTLNRVRYDDGDAIVAVQWYKRLGGYTEQRTYQREKNSTGRPWTDYFNACELCVVNAEVDLVGGPPLQQPVRCRQRRRCRGAGSASAAERTAQAKKRAAEDAEARRLWALDPQSTVLALAECRWIARS